MIKNSEVEAMSVFDAITFDDNNTEVKKDEKELKTSNDMLDYMALVLSREMSCRVAFKGGYLLNQLLSQSRLTHDIDLSLAKKGEYDEVKRVLKEIADAFIEKDLIFDYKIKENISETTSGGIDMYDCDGKKILGADIGLHNISYGINHYVLAITELDGFSPERMVIDKVLAILSPKRFRRTKDLYDLYAITNVFNLDVSVLYQCIALRTNYDTTVWDHIPFSEDIILQYSKAWDKLKLTPYNDDLALEKPDFLEVLTRFNSIAFTLKKHTDGVFWDHVSKCWKNIGGCHVS